MPVLSDSDLLAMRAQLRHCDQCLAIVLKNYCRQCDEFFEYGHDDKCKRNVHQHEKHAGHRTY